MQSPPVCPALTRQNLLWDCKNLPFPPNHLPYIQKKPLSYPLWKLLYKSPPGHLPCILAQMEFCSLPGTAPQHLFHLLPDTEAGRLSHLLYTLQMKHPLPLLYIVAKGAFHFLSLPYIQTKTTLHFRSLPGIPAKTALRFRFPSFPDIVQMQMLHPLLYTAKEKVFSPLPPTFQLENPYSFLCIAQSAALLPQSAKFPLPP